MAMNSGDPPGLNAGQGVEPYKATLSRLQETHADPPEVLLQRAVTWLQQAFGVSDNTQTSGYSYGGVGLLAQHTSYFNGFAVVLKIPNGIAVAVRLGTRGGIRVSIARGPAGPTISADEERVWIRLVKTIAVQYLEAGVSADIAIASTMPPGCFEANLGALATAAAEAFSALPNVKTPEDSLKTNLAAIEASIDAEYSRAYLLAGRIKEENVFLVIDTETHEVIPFQGPGREHLSWGIIDVGIGSPQAFSFYKQCGMRANQALDFLQKKMNGQLPTFREVAHEDAARILNELPKRLRPIVRHLITENKRVYSLIKAIKRQDWQMMGVLLLMSHASLQSDWKGTSPEVDFVVDGVREKGGQGMYGASITGRSGCVLVAGLPIVFARAMTELQNSYEQRFRSRPKFWIL